MMDPSSSSECGLQRPDLGWWAWLRDTHAMLALLAAVPIWLAPKGAQSLLR